MNEKQMLEKLESARKQSAETHSTVYALSNGSIIAVALDNTTVKALKGIGYWVCSIFENGNRVEA